MKNRSVTMLLCAVLLIGLLAGCSNKTAGNDVPNNTTTPNAVTDGTENGIVNDTDGMIDDQNATTNNNARTRSDEPVTDRVFTDMDNAVDRTGNAIENGANRMKNAVENGVNDMTGRNTRTR